MNTRKIYLNDIVRQLLMLDYEITLLKFRVEEAVPEVMRECYGQVRRLLEQHQALEAQVKDLEEMPDDTWTDHCAEIDCALAELLELFVSARSWINMRLSEPVRSRAFFAEMDTDSDLVRRPGVKIKSRRKKKLPERL